jgi:N-acetylmuramoyl-L-alanine amidase
MGSICRSRKVSKSPEWIKEKMGSLITPVMCLAITIFFEAGNQGKIGMLAVGRVVLNRVADTRFPDDICSVVKEGPVKNGLPVKNRCQFSFWCDGKSDVPAPSDRATFHRTTNLAIRLLRGEYATSVGAANFYHATYVSPDWSFVKPDTATLKIGDHIFYTLPKGEPR